MGLLEFRPANAARRAALSQSEIALVGVYSPFGVFLIEEIKRKHKRVAWQAGCRLVWQSGL